MNAFKKPELSIVYLTNENVLTASECQKVTCYNYFCDDCVECPNGYTCDIFACTKSYNK